LISITIIILSLAFWVIVLNRKFFYGFSDNFKRRLNLKWDFIGPWKITDDNILIVTGSDEGGMTKNGADWENYTFTFKAKINSKCIGVVVRAADLNNYYMLQIGQNQIIPHRRMSYPKIKRALGDHTLIEIEVQTGWQVYKDLSVEHNTELNKWFKGTIIVKGQSISLYINGELVLNIESFLQNSKGKIGFRCAGNEVGYIKEVKVRLKT